MASEPENKEPIPLGPWPKGMNNRSRASEIPREQLRDILNLDITNSGSVLRRYGSTSVHAGEAHSLAGAHGRLYWVENGQLWADHQSPVSIYAGPISLPLSYTLVNGELFWSNQNVSGRIIDGVPPVNLPWVPETPATFSAGATSPGFMYAGRYLVTCTFEFEDLREGGAPTPVLAELTANQAIFVTLPQPTQAEVTNIRVYVSDPNGEQMYFVGKYPAGTLSATIQRAHRGRILETLHLEPLTPGSIIGVLDGKMFSVNGNTAWFSEPFRFGLMRPRANFFTFAGPIKIFLPCEDGYWVVADSVYWLNNTDPNKAEAVAHAEDDAVLGTGIILPREQGVMWFGERGWMKGEAGGKLSTPMDAQIAVSSYQRGAALYREQRGIRQVVSSLHQPGLQSKFVASDFMDAEIVRKKP